MHRPASLAEFNAPSPLGRRVRAAAVVLAGLLACVTLGAAQAQQKLYRWVDETGKVRFSDRPPPASVKKVEVKALGAKQKDAPSDPYQLQVARRANPVKLYTAPDCGEGCSEARNYLNARGIPFAEISVTDSARLEDLKQATGQAGVPAMMVGTAVHKGYEQGLYERVLDAAGYPKAGILPARTSTATAPPAAPRPAAAAPEPAKAAAPKAPELGPYAPRFGADDKSADSKK